MGYRVWLVVLLSALIATGCATTEKDGVPMRLNIPMPTLGGKQYWADVDIYGGWRIQQNVFTHHYRLLDPKDIRRAWGSLEQCGHALDDAKTRGDAALRSRRLCILLHAYLRSKDSMGKLKRVLEAAGYEAYAVSYPSSRGTIDVFADQVAGLLDRAQTDFDEINFVTHSMGGIVARRVLSQRDFPKAHRLVMIAPPNQGAVMADLLLGWWPSQYVFGPAGKQLGTEADSYVRNVGVPTCEFGVIAGAKGNRKGWNPFIPGDDDGLVGIDETRLDGMSDFVTVRALHTGIMKRRESIRQTIAFLEDGRFDHCVDQGPEAAGAARSRGDNPNGGKEVR